MSELQSLTVAHPEIAKLDGQTIRPLADGTTELIAKAQDGSEARMKVTVSGMQGPCELSFRHDVQSILARQGCSMAHATEHSQARAVFACRCEAMTLIWITNDRSRTGGRRVQIERPAYSLLLTKPTGALPHKGGLRLDTQSNDYRLLADWIASGAKGPAATDPKLLNISVEPAVAFLQPQDQSQLLVRAHYDNGTSRDVTHWAKYSATDEAVAMVDEQGQIKVQGSGEAAVMVWFGSKVALARMTVPFTHAVDEHSSLRHLLITSSTIEPTTVADLATCSCATD